MSDDVRQIEPDYDGIVEEWERLTDEPEIRGVASSNRINEWVVNVYVQQIYPTDDPLGAELRQRIQGALRAVDRVIDVCEHDGGSWEVTGAPSGEALTRAAACVVDERPTNCEPTARHWLGICAGWRPTKVGLARYLPSAEAPGRTLPDRS
jgi:hypothetical protein